MATSKPCLTVRGITVQVVRKNIKHLHLAVYPPDGQVRVAVPAHITDDNVRLAVISRLSWIKRQQQDFVAQPRQSERQYVTGECHYYSGQRLRLVLRECHGKHAVVLKKSGQLQMTVQPNTTVENKAKLLNAWYRAALNQQIPALIAHWQPRVGETVNAFGIKKMKTRWGSCNRESGKIWLNLELAKKPVECLEYIVVHEMVHLLERHHNDQFKAHMDRLLPKWRGVRDTLNGAPLRHERWEY